MSVRQQMPRTYSVFFGRHGTPLRPIQTLAVGPLLEGRDALLCAPTAGGKTEAYMAPLVERALSLPEAARGRPHVLVVTPTRALANDLFERMAGLVEQAGGTMGRYTAEHKERRGGGLGLVTVVTPEGLDSLLARQPKTLAGVRAVVLDELHVLDGSVRGDHALALLHRLQKLPERQGAPLQRVAASATVSAPERLAARYLGREAQVLQVGPGDGAQAAAEPRVTAWRREHPTLTRDCRRVLAELHDRGVRKVLVFVASRDACDTLSHDLKDTTPYGERVFPHHGSLSRQVREHTERQMKTGRSGVVVATPTLEVGIDIGSLDYVLLASRPPDVASLLQRIGRSGRRGQPPRFGYFTACEADDLVFRVLCRHATRGELLQPVRPPRRSVVVQQALVLAAARYGVTEDELREALPEPLRPSPADVRELLEQLVRKEHLKPGRHGRFAPTDRTAAAYEHGRLHSNFGEGPTAEVVEQGTGRPLGRVSTLALDGLRGDRHVMGGRHLQLERLETERRRVEVRLLGRAPEGAVPLRYTTHPPPAVPFELGRAVARTAARRLGRNLGRHALPLLPLPEDGWLLLHGLGTMGAEWLAWRLERDGWAVGPTSRFGRRSPFATVLVPEREGLQPPLPERLPIARKDAMRFLRGLGRSEVRFARRLGMGRYHHLLPRSQRLESMLRVSRLLSTLGWLRRATLRRLDSPPPDWLLDLAMPDAERGWSDADLGDPPAPPGEPTRGEPAGNDPGPREVQPS